MGDLTQAEMLAEADRWLKTAAATMYGLDKMVNPSNAHIQAEAARALAEATIGRGWIELARSFPPMTVVQNFTEPPLTPEEAIAIRKWFERAANPE